MSNKITKVSVHPLSRKSKEKKRLMLRDIKLSVQRTTVSNEKHIPLINRLTWFQLYLAGSPAPPSLSELQDAIREYIDRNKDDMVSRREQLRKDRPVPKKLQEMEELRSMETKEFSSSGIELPKMLSAKDFEAFQRWNGDYSALSQFQMIKYKI